MGGPRWLAGIGAPSSAPKIGAGLDDAAHLVEPPGRALAAARAKVPDASRSPALGGHGNLQGQPGGGGVGGEFEGVVRTIHARSMGEWIRHWLSEGSLDGAGFFQTIVRLELGMGYVGDWARCSPGGSGAAFADEIEGEGVGS